MRLIDADALGKRIKKRMRKKGSFEGKEMTELGYAMLCLHEAETVDAERHGQWVKENKEYTFVCVYKCSLCGGEVLSEAYLFKYCPYCGAKMDEVEE